MMHAVNFILGALTGAVVMAITLAVWLFRGWKH